MAVREVTVLAAGGTIAMAGTDGAVPELDAAAIVAAVPELAGAAGAAGAHARRLARGPRRARRRARDRPRGRRRGRRAAAAWSSPTAPTRWRRPRCSATSCTAATRRSCSPARSGPPRPPVRTGPPTCSTPSAPRAQRPPPASARSSASAASCTPPAPCARPTPCPRARSPRRGRARSGRVAEESVEVWGDAGAAAAAARRAARRAGGDRPRGARRRRRAARRGDRRGRRRPRRRPARRGHAPPAFLEACRRAARRVPVVACVRPERGRILRGTYGFAGGERDVRDAGLICAPALSPAAARITLMACLGAGHSRVATAAVFAADDRAWSSRGRARSADWALPTWRHPGCGMDDPTRAAIRPEASELAMSPTRRTAVHEPTTTAATAGGTPA